MSMVSPYVVKSENGEQFIPASQRADGSWRKARKVKDGYIPQDEVPIYQSKGKKWAAGKSAYPVGLDPTLIREKELKESAAAEKLRKQKAAKKVVAPGAPIPKTSLPAPEDKPLKPDDKDQPKPPYEEPFVQVSKKQSPRSKKAQPSNSVGTTANVSTNAPQDPTKRLRNLRKKLKEVETLEAKIASKELKNPDKDQLEKVRKKVDLQDEILALELSLSTIS